MKYVMGIDQGSSKTYAIVGDDGGNVLGFGKSYGACHSNTGMKYAMKAVKEAVNEALQQAGLELTEIDTLAAGMTGMDWEFEEELLREELEQLTHIRNIVVVNDCIIAMRAGSSRPYGAVLCAGSGLNCAARNRDGKEFVYGFYIEEEYQGGSALGKACIKAVTDSYVGMEEKTMLTEMLLKKFDCKDVDGLLFKKVTEKISLEDYLSLPIVLEEAAHMGDKVSKNIWYRFGKQFGRYVIAAMKRMDMLGYEAEVVLSGSIFKCKEPELRQGVEDELKREAPLAKIVDAVYEPIVGAYLMAIEQSEKESGIVFRNLEKYSSSFRLKRV